MADYVNICVFGDSISQGFFDLEKGGWVNRMKLHFMGKGVDPIVYDCGIESNTTKDLLKRFEGELISRLYFSEDEECEYDSYVIFAIGKNDSLFEEHKENTWVGLEEFENNLRKLILKTRRFTDNIIFIGTGCVDESKTLPFEEDGKSYCNENLEKYNSVIGEVCNKENVRFISIQGVLDVEKDLSDGVHPNASGHQKIFEKVLPVVEGMIGEVKNE